MKRFQWKWIFTGSTTCYGGHFESKMAAKIKKILRFGQHLVSKQILVLRIDNRHRFWNWEPCVGVMSAIALQWQFQLFLLFLFFFRTFLSAPFLGDALIKLYETLQEYHMPCEVVLLRVYFFKMAAIAMETAKMLKN